jgi:hypothetical protein
MSAFLYAIEILPSSKQGGKGEKESVFLSDVHVVCLLLLKKKIYTGSKFRIFTYFEGI